MRGVTGPEESFRPSAALQLAAQRSLAHLDALERAMDARDPELARAEYEPLRVALSEQAIGAIDFAERVQPGLTHCASVWTWYRTLDAAMQSMCGRLRIAEALSDERWAELVRDVHALREGIARHAAEVERDVVEPLENRFAGANGGELRHRAFELWVKRTQPREEQAP